MWGRGHPGTKGLKKNLKHSRTAHVDKSFACSSNVPFSILSGFFMLHTKHSSRNNHAFIGTSDARRLPSATIYE